MPVKVVQTQDGRVRAYRYNLGTGGFDIANSVLDRIILAQPDDEVYCLDEAGFVELTERERALGLRGDGPVFELYRQIPTADPDEVPAIRRRTFQLWEVEFARRDAGEPPSFRVEPSADRRPDPTPDMAHDA